MSTLETHPLQFLGQRRGVTVIVLSQERQQRPILETLAPRRRVLRKPTILHYLDKYPRLQHVSALYLVHLVILKRPF